MPLDRRRNFSWLQAGDLCCVSVEKKREEENWNLNWYQNYKGNKI